MTILITQNQLLYVNLFCSNCRKCKKIFLNKIMEFGNHTALCHKKPIRKQKTISGTNNLLNSFHRNLFPALFKKKKKAFFCSTSDFVFT